MQHPYSKTFIMFLGMTLCSLVLRVNAASTVTQEKESEEVTKLRKKYTDLLFKHVPTLNEFTEKSKGKRAVHNGKRIKNIENKNRERISVVFSHLLNHLTNKKNRVIGESNKMKEDIKTLERNFSNLSANASEICMEAKKESRTAQERSDLKVNSYYKTYKIYEGYAKAACEQFRKINVFASDLRNIVNIKSGENSTFNLDFVNGVTPEKLAKSTYWLVKLLEGFSKIAIIRKNKYEEAKRKINYLKSEYEKVVKKCKKKLTNAKESLKPLCLETLKKNDDGFSCFRESLEKEVEASIKKTKAQSYNEGKAAGTEAAKFDPTKLTIKVETISGSRNGKYKSGNTGVLSGVSTTGNKNGYTIKWDQEGKPKNYICNPKNFKITSVNYDCPSQGPVLKFNNSTARRLAELSD